MAWRTGRRAPTRRPAPRPWLQRGRHRRLRDHLPDGFAYAAVRAPIAEGGGYAWFANRGIGRPVAESLADTMAWFRTWLEDAAPPGQPVVLVGFSGGAAFAIPRELLDRTWAYLHSDAGSTTTGVRDAGGHGLSAAAVGELARWLTEVADRTRSDL